jgi:hypothetical protein
MRTARGWSATGAAPASPAPPPARPCSTRTDGSAHTGCHVSGPPCERCIPTDMQTRIHDAATQPCSARAPQLYAAKDTGGCLSRTHDTASLLLDARVVRPAVTQRPRHAASRGDSQARVLDLVRRELRRGPVGAAHGFGLVERHAQHLGLIRRFYNGIKQEIVQMSTWSSRRTAGRCWGGSGGLGCGGTNGPGPSKPRRCSCRQGASSKRPPGGSAMSASASRNTIHAGNSPAHFVRTRCTSRARPRPW